MDKKLTAIELFKKYKTDFFDANGAKTEVLTQQRFQVAITEFVASQSSPVVEPVSAEEILAKYENRPSGWQQDDILQAMEEYAQSVTNCNQPKEK